MRKYFYKYIRKRKHRKMGSLELPLIKDSKQPASKQMKSSPRLLAARKVHFQTTVRHCYTVTLAPSAQT